MTTRFGSDTFWKSYEIKDCPFGSQFKQELTEFRKIGVEKSTGKVAKFIWRKHPNQKAMARLLDISDSDITNFKTNTKKQPAETVNKIYLWYINVQYKYDLMDDANEFICRDKYSDKTVNRVKKDYFLDEKYLNCIAAALDNTNTSYIAFTRDERRSLSPSRVDKRVSPAQVDQAHSLGADEQANLSEQLQRADLVKQGEDDDVPAKPDDEKSCTNQ